MQTGDRTLRLTLYATPSQPLTAPEENDPRLDRLTITTPAPGVTQLDLTLQDPIRGFHADHDDTGLLLTVRQPPPPPPPPRHHPRPRPRRHPEPRRG